MVLVGAWRATPLRKAIRGKAKGQEYDGELALSIWRDCIGDSRDGQSKVIGGVHQAVAVDIDFCFLWFEHGVILYCGESPRC